MDLRAISRNEREGHVQVKLFSKQNATRNKANAGRNG